MQKDAAKITQEQGQNINYWVCAFVKDRDTYKDKFEATDAKLGRLEQIDGSVGNRLFDSADSFLENRTDGSVKPIIRSDTRPQT